MNVLMQGRAKPFLNTFRRSAQPLVLQLRAFRIVATIDGLFIALALLMRLRKMSVVRLGKRRSQKLFLRLIF